MTFAKHECINFRLLDGYEKINDIDILMLDT